MKNKKSIVISFSNFKSNIPLSGGKSLQYKNCGKITRLRSMLLGKLVKWVPLGLQRPNIYQLFTLNLMKPCLKFAPEATFKQMYSTCSSFKQSFQVVRQRCAELQLESVSHLIFRLERIFCLFQCSIEIYGVFAINFGFLDSY